MPALQLYAEKQFPGNPEQQAVLIHQLQQEHYHQYMQQLHLQNQTQSNLNQQEQQTKEVDKDKDMDKDTIVHKQQQQQQEHNNSNMNNNNNNSSSGGSSISNNSPGHPNLVQAMDTLHLKAFDCQQQEQQEQLPEQLVGNDEYEDYVMIRPAKIWTRPDIEQFKTEVSAGDGDGVITIGHGDTVTVRITYYDTCLL